jgi:hypothetical protein
MAVRRVRKDDILEVMKSTPTEESHEDEPTYTDENLNEVFMSVLEHLQIDEKSKLKFLKNETRERKLHIIQTHLALQSKGTGVLESGEKEIALLNSLVVDTPDLVTMVQIREILETGSIVALETFLHSGGIIKYEKIVKHRISVASHSIMSILDAAILYEVVRTYKILVNNTEGMRAFVNTNGLISRMTQCIRFEWKPLALEVIIIYINKFYNYSDI